MILIVGNQDKMIEPISAGEFRLSKTLDCSVRAFANASLLEYEEVEKILLTCGRKINKGASANMLLAAANLVGFKNVTVFGNDRRGYLHPKVAYRYEKGTELKTFLKKHPKGRFVVLYYKHVVAVIDGQIVDTIANRPNARVIAAFSR